MLNYANLSDIEFEYLCQDIMQKKLGIELRRFAPGKDGGIDLMDNAAKPNVIVQVKHYVNSTSSQLKAALQEELPKVKAQSPKQYYVCCCKTLSPQAVKGIYQLFSDYMVSKKNVLTLNEIEDFLQKPENSDVLEKHYKLWLDATGVLQNLLNGDIFVDCEALLADIEKDKKLFVRTSVFDKALELLSHDKTLFIVGDPGVGKSMTSKMLVLHYVASGYRARYTSNCADLSALKRSLSRDQNVKEIILIDDCFGQAYFDLKDSQNSDLLALIKYVHIAKNKLLILNSRVTIFQEAKERRKDFVKSFENHEYGVCVLDMSEISMFEKAKIFYNHLFMNGVKGEYFYDIRIDRRYRRIIEHKNYNPRIIEFVSNPNRYAEIAPNQYCEFIMQNLDHPSEVWKDEYERRLSLADRILLLTVFSLSDVFAEESLVKACFEEWIKNEPTIDRTINQYEASLLRLTNSFLRIIDQYGRKKIGVVNPSINDYLDSRILGDSAERDFLLRNVCSIQQFYRLLSEEEFEDLIYAKLSSGEINNILFHDEQQKNALITWYIAKDQILDMRYIQYVQAYLQIPSEVFLEGDHVISKLRTLEKLVSQPLVDYYRLKNIMDEYDLRCAFDGEDPQELVPIINALSPLFESGSREQFVSMASEALLEALDDYYGDVDASDYDPDVRMAVELSLLETDDGPALDENNAEALIEEEVADQIEVEIAALLCQLPKDIREAENYLDEISVCISGTEDIVDSYLADERYDYLDPKEDADDMLAPDEIDLMFDR